MPESKRVCCACRRKVRIINWYEGFPTVKTEFSYPSGYVEVWSLQCQAFIDFFCTLEPPFLSSGLVWKLFWWHPYCFADQPKILSAPSSLQVVEGNGAILFCNATGYPEPNITWTKQGNEIVLSTLQVLNLTSLMREDNGAVYTCIVQNYLGTVKASAMVTVFCEYSDFVFVWSNMSSLFFF